MVGRGEHIWDRNLNSVLLRSLPREIGTAQHLALSRWVWSEDHISLLFVVGKICKGIMRSRVGFLLQPNSPISK